MATSFFESASPAPDLHAPPACDSGPYLVALDGGRRGDSAIAAAAAFAEQTGAHVEIVSVVRDYSTAGSTRWIPDEIAAHRARRLSRIRDRIRSVLKRSENWPITLASGSRADAIVRVARARHATLIILGVTRLGHLERLIRGSTRLALIERSPVPVLAVPPDWAGRPRRVVVATDFGEESIRGAQLALDLMASRGLLYLAHITPRNRIASAGASRIEQRLRTLADALPCHPTTKVEAVSLVGDVMEEIGEFAEGGYTDLLVMGLHGPGRMARSLWTSAPRRFLRRAMTGVMVVPSNSE